MNNAQLIHSEVLKYGFSDKLAMFAAAQAGHETSGFTSSIFRNNNNAFGMKFAGQSSAQGEKNGYAYYTTVEQSIYDWVKWWSKKRSNPFSLPLFVNSVNTFVAFLKNNNYFEAKESEYLTGVQYFYNQYFG